MFKESHHVYLYFQSAVLQFLVENDATTVNMCGNLADYSSDCQYSYSALRHLNMASK